MDISPILSFLGRIAPQVIGSILSASVAYYIFYLGHQKSKKKEEERLSNLRMLFQLTLFQLKVGVEVQIKEFEDLTDILKTDLEKQHAIFRSTSLSLDSLPKSILNIDRNDVYKFFVQDRKDQKLERIKLFSNLYNSLYVLEKIIDRMQVNDSDNNKRFRTCKYEVEHTMDKLVAFLMQATKKALEEKKSVDDPVYIKIMRIYDSYTEKKTYTIDDIMHSFVIPISKFIPNQEFVVHNDSQSIIALIQHAETHYSTILEDKQNHLFNCEHWTSHYKNILTIINRILEIEL